MQRTSGHLASLEEIVSRLMELGLSPEESERCAGDKDNGLRTAAADGKLDVVKYLVEECKADVNARDVVTQHREQQAVSLVWWLSCGCCRLREPR